MAAKANEKYGYNEGGGNKGGIIIYQMILSTEEVCLERRKRGIK